MSFTRMMEGNEAAAYGAMVSRAEVVPAYPITPQTELISHIATLISEGKMRAEYIKVEGEHTAMAAACGASAAGARVFTASSSQARRTGKHEMGRLRQVPEYIYTGTADTSQEYAESREEIGAARE